MKTEKKPNNNDTMENTQNADKQGGGGALSIQKTHGKPPAIIAQTQSAHNYYYYLIKYLIDNKMFEKIDRYTVAMCANSLHFYAEAVKEVREKGAIQTFKTGATNVSAYYTVMKDQSKTFQEFSDRLGLDAKAREKLQAFAKGEDVDPFADL